jgi:hypothetical protein
VQRCFKAQSKAAYSVVDLWTNRIESGVIKINELRLIDMRLICQLIKNKITFNFYLPSCEQYETYIAFGFIFTQSVKAVLIFAHRRIDVTRFRLILKPLLKGGHALELLHHVVREKTH